MFKQRKQDFIKLFDFIDCGIDTDAVIDEGRMIVSSMKKGLDQKRKGSNTNHVILLELLNG
ncbi:MAG: hypothetical protein ACLSGW_04545 [Clostridium sp.]|nr:hypothetical protein GKZ87_01770 [Erysipelotrichaceae bacterium 66202529]